MPFALLSCEWSYSSPHSTADAHFSQWRIYGVAVYSATPVCLVTAISAVKLSLSISVVLIELLVYIGGMSTANGADLRDLCLEISSCCFINVRPIETALLIVASLLFERQKKKWQKARHGRESKLAEILSITQIECYNQQASHWKLMDKYSRVTSQYAQIHLVTNKRMLSRIDPLQCFSSRTAHSSTAWNSSVAIAQPTKRRLLLLKAFAILHMSLELMHRSIRNEKQIHRLLFFVSFGLSKGWNCVDVFRWCSDIDENWFCEHHFRSDRNIRWAAHAYLIRSIIVNLKLGNESGPSFE